LGVSKKKIVHKLNKYGTGTECSNAIDVGFGSTVSVNKTWRGVTCKRCLAKKGKK
jgi:hypothetical protein